MKKEIRLLIIFITTMTLIIVRSIKTEEKSYEYALNNEIGISDNCYLKEDIAYCEVDGMRIQVDNFYEVKE